MFIKFSPHSFNGTQIVVVSAIAGFGDCWFCQLLVSLFTIARVFSILLIFVKNQIFVSLISDFLIFNLKFSEVQFIHFYIDFCSSLFLFLWPHLLTLFFFFQILELETWIIYFRTFLIPNLSSHSYEFPSQLCFSSMPPFFDILYLHFHSVLCIVQISFEISFLTYGYLKFCYLISTCLEIFLLFLRHWLIIFFQLWSKNTFCMICIHSYLSGSVLWPRL